MKFSEMPYERPDADALKAHMSQLTDALKQAPDYAAARGVFLDMEAFQSHVSTLSTLVSIRQSIDTRDPFYDAEQAFWDGLGPELEEYEQAWNSAMLSSPFRKDFSEEYGDLMFVNSEIRLRTYAPELIPDLKAENELTTQYSKLIASAQIPFEGKTYTLSQLSPFKNDPDDARRLAAWKAEGQWYKEHQAELDDIYHRLTQLRDTMGRKLGHSDYIPLGYDRMGRNCYTKADVERFRAAVVKYLVPVADSIKRAQAERMGVSYPMSYADEALTFRSGNPKPHGTPDDIVAHGKTFYDALSPETGEFFRSMLDGEVMSLLSTEGKAGGGYCTIIPDYHTPFIFANFNGTQHDVEVITHEAGHAFECYLNRNRIPMEYIWPSMEACEVHSMSMEFFAWPWAEGFFGKDTRKFYYSHLASALTFIPYGTLVDHFQHEVYERPEMTPAQRHAAWKRLQNLYMPWIKLDGDIPFYGEGQAWQRQQHIYCSPFYYIDYCLAQTVALQFWAKIQKDLPSAWVCYMDYTKQGGSKTFTELLRTAGLKTPFDEACLKEVCAAASDWLTSFDLSSLN